MTQNRRSFIRSLLALPAAFVGAKVVVDAQPTPTPLPPSSSDEVYWRFIGVDESARIVVDSFGEHIPLNRCPHVFKDSSCGYRGGAVSCDKTVLECVNRENFHHFGFAHLPKGISQMKF